MPVSDGPRNNHDVVRTIAAKSRSAALAPERFETDALAETFETVPRGAGTGEPFRTTLGCSPASDLHATHVKQNGNAF